MARESDPLLPPAGSAVPARYTRGSEVRPSPSPYATQNNSTTDLVSTASYRTNDDAATEHHISIFRNFFPERPAFKIRKRARTNSLRAPHSAASAASAVESVYDFGPGIRGRPQLIRFLAYCAFGILFFLGFNLVFLPRTSLGRDLRRLHESKVTYFDAERLLFHSLDTGTVDDQLRRLATGRRLPGDNYPSADYTETAFRALGFSSVARKQYDIYLNMPVRSSVRLLDPNTQAELSRLQLSEDVFPEGPASVADAVPAFHGYSASGNVMAPYFDAGWGSAEEFRSFGNVTGRIALIRTGDGISAGVKVRLAEHFGCAAVLLFRDPAFDYPAAVDSPAPYPVGPGRNPSSIERDTVLLTPQKPGDPGNPWHGLGRIGKPSAPPESLPRIPSLPISPRDANTLLASFKSQNQAENLTFAPILHVESHQEYKLRPIVNVFATIDGIIPGEAIIIGNHRDAWAVGGVADPGSGSAVLLEVASAFAQLAKKGWKPTRSLVFASWDGGAAGQLGSTAWGEDKSGFVARNVLAYVNLDRVVSGTKFTVAGSRLLQAAAETVAAKIPAPQLPQVDSKVPYLGEPSLYDYWVAQSDSEHSKEPQKPKKPEFGLLGAGSDYSVFQHHLGVPSLDFGFRAAGTDPVPHLHSSVDCYGWSRRFLAVNVTNSGSDATETPQTSEPPRYPLHTAAGKFAALLALELSEREVIFFHTAPYAEQIESRVAQLVTQVPKSWLNRVPDSAGFGAKLRRYLGWDGADSEPLANLLDRLKTRAAALTATAAEFDATADAAQAGFTVDYPWFRMLRKLVLMFRIRALNYRLFNFDRWLLHKEGLVGVDKVEDAEKMAESVEISELSIGIVAENVADSTKPLISNSTETKKSAEFAEFAAGYRNRPWMRHVVYAPQIMAGPGDLLPGLREALLFQDFDATVAAVGVLLDKLGKVHGALEGGIAAAS